MMLIKLFLILLLINGVRFVMLVFKIFRNGW